jgi:hypothetical protein
MMDEKKWLRIIAKMEGLITVLKNEVKKKEKVKKTKSRSYFPISPLELKIKVREAFYSTDGDETYFDRTLFLDAIEKDLKVSFSFENHSDDQEYITLGDFTFILMWGGGDWECAIHFIVYWDGRRFRAYIPTDGNPWNTDTKRAYGNDAEADLKNVRKRFPKDTYYQQLSLDDAEDASCFCFEDREKMFEDIRRRFGIEKT